VVARKGVKLTITSSVFRREDAFLEGSIPRLGKSTIVAPR
jgi:hypothetical protein